MKETLAQELESELVSEEHLNANYKPVLQMVRELIGVIPNCNPVLEIWPPAFRSFNLLVPNLLNLPASLLGQGAPKDLVGIAMYSSSNAAGCPYCTAHHCSFAIRRGADPNAVLGDRTPAEAAVAELAEAMAWVPGKVTPDLVARVEQHLSPQDTEWIALAVSLGGFLNKFMDTMGIQLEESTILETQALLRPTGWDPGKHFWTTEADEGDADGRTLSSVRLFDVDPEIDNSEEIPVDNIATFLRVFRAAPGAVRLEKGWTKGVSGKLGPALLMLEEEIGYSFPALASIHSPKVIKAVATALRDNLDPELTSIGIRTKLLAGLVYARYVESDLLTAETLMLFELLVPDIDPMLLSAIKRFADLPATETVIPRGLSSEESAAIMLAKAASGSPANVSEITIAAIRPTLSAPDIVELVSWLSLFQLLNRLYQFLDAKYPEYAYEEGVEST